MTGCCVAGEHLEEGKEARKKKERSVVLMWQSNFCVCSELWAKDM